MKRHTQRIVAVALLALAGGAFCVDRFVLGYSSPQAAAAAPVAQGEAPRARPAPAPEAAPEVSVSKRLAALKDRLPAWGREDERDAMTIPATWNIDRPVVEEKPLSVTSVNKPEFPKFALTTVVEDTSGGGGLAIMNGRTVRVGDQIEGYTVESIKTGKTSDPAAVVVRGPAGEMTVESSRVDGIVFEGSKSEAAKAARGKK